jgi:hypothetical protein
VELADRVGSDFTRGVAEVTLASAQSAAGDREAAAATYRDLIEHWLRSGTWTQQWTTLRNAAALLETSDPATALTIICAAEVDPFSPALTSSAQKECERLRSRLARRLGADEAGTITQAAAHTSCTELAARTREGLSQLITADPG